MFEPGKRHGAGYIWTEEEVSKLKAFYASKPNHGDMEVFAKSIGKTFRATHLKAMRLGLTKQYNIFSEGQPSSREAQSRKRFADMIKNERKGQGKYAQMTEEQVRLLLDKFRESSASLEIFARQHHHDDGMLSTLFRKYFAGDYELIQEAKLIGRDKWYKRGRDFEYSTRDYLKKKGYWVLRSPRSGSPVDLVAIKKNRILMVQCKISTSYLGTAARKDLADICQTTGAIALLAYRPSPHKIAFRQVSEDGYANTEIS